MTDKKLDLIIKNADVVLSAPQNPTHFKLEKLDIGIRDGKVDKIGTLQHLEAQTVFDAKGLTVLPGLIDTQVHFREPGLEHKETLETGSHSAVAGGITGYFEMPNTSPPTLTAENLAQKVRIAEEKSYCDFSFYLGSAESNLGMMAELEMQRGCCGVKVFMGSSTGSLLIDTDELLKRVLENTRRRVAVHCEDEPRLIERKHLAEQSGGDVSQHPVWRDDVSSLKATQRLITLAKQLNRKVHVLHVSTHQEMTYLAEQKNGDLITVEVTPQHLTLESPDCYINLGTRAQMNPPIRETLHRQGLWKALQSGVVDLIGSDHAPHTLEEKGRVYPRTPSGMPGVQTIVPLMLDHMHKGRLSLFDIVRLLAVNPAQIFSIKNRGFIAPGYEGTLTIVDLNRTQKIEDSWIRSKVGWTPFHGMTVKGWPVATILRGEFAMREDQTFKLKAQPFEFF